MGSFRMHLLAVKSHLRPRFGYIFDHYGNTRSRRRASARRGESRLYPLYLLGRRCHTAVSLEEQSLAPLMSGDQGKANTILCKRARHA